MNIQEFDILNTIRKKPYTNQRDLAEATGHSLGVVNRSLKKLMEEDYLSDQVELTEKALLEFEEKKPKNAIILAAGFGMRMVPINTETPKGLLEVAGEPLIERQIKQLHEVGIRDISVVVGFMKEQYEYLIDKYGVKLVVNPEYSTKNNLFSLRLVSKELSNTYIIPCDVWCKENPFNSFELYSWYMVSDENDPESSVRVNRKMELVAVSDDEDGNAMIGISYLLEKDACFVRERMEGLAKKKRNEKAFWEEALYAKGKMIIYPYTVPMADVVEINTYEQLRELDSNSNHLKSDALLTAAWALEAKPEEIKNITVLKKGMTNRSFLFECRGEKYIMRIPGEGTEQLIDRRKEAQVYQAISERKLCDDVIYINSENGYKITKFLHGARVCDPMNQDDVYKCMKKLREFHDMNLKVAHRFDIFRQIEFYESLWDGKSSIYKDYAETKEKVMSLKGFTEEHKEKEVLTHIDAVPDNFLFVSEGTSKEDIRLIDWEYAGMQDPHVDVAMFCIYSLYDRKQADDLIQAYFPEGCTDMNRIKIYCYIAMGGLLWSNWCEYKRNLGIDFGEYSLRQYRYAKEFYNIAKKELSTLVEMGDSMHRVKRAIIMAAGTGSRMRPVTELVPKPLVEVNGIRMIDTVIQGLLHNGIREIYVVTGYLKDKFCGLEAQYPEVQLIENPYFDKCNNISSLYVAREHLEDVMILDGDQIIYNEDILRPEFEKSGYNCVWTDEQTDEWLLTVEEGTVCGCSRTGGAGGWQLFSISRWTAEDGKRLKRHLEIEFEENENRQIYWDDIVMFCYPKEYNLGIVEMNKGDVIEVDNLHELAALDAKYQIYLDGGEGNE